MSRDWLFVVNLGSFATIGVALVFAVVWVIDRGRLQALSFAGSIVAYFAGNLVLSVHADIALLSSIHGVLFPLGLLLLADGLLRRADLRLGYETAIAYFVASAAPVWFFAYVVPLMLGRIVTQCLCGGILFLVVAARLRGSARRQPRDRLTMAATATLSLSLLVNIALAAFSTIPSEITSDAEMDAYLATPLEAGLILSSAVILPGVLIVLLAVTIADVVADLRRQRDEDELTGLLNRRGFTERAEALLRRCPECTLVLADLDFFKEVNDALGHAGGDFALSTFADVLAAMPCVGQATGRVGGEEFAVLLPAGGVTVAVDFAEAVRAKLAMQSIVYGGATASITASFGVAQAVPTSTLRELMDAADRALYDAKARGRNCTAVQKSA